MTFLKVRADLLSIREAIRAIQGEVIDSLSGSLTAWSGKYFQTRKRLRYHIDVLRSPCLGHVVLRCIDS